MSEPRAGTPADDDADDVVASLRARLADAEETLEAIRSGDVDAIIVGDSVYTLDTANAASNRLRSDVLAQMKDAVIAVDENERVVFLNPAAETQYGLTASQALGHPIGQLFTVRWYGEGDASAARAALQRAASWRGAAMHVRRDGVALHVEATITSLADAGPAGGMVIVSRDVSDRYRAKEALEAAVRGLARATRSRRSATRCARCGCRPTRRSTATRAR